jgi:acetate kinase
MAKKLNQAYFLTINGDSSSIKFAIFKVGDSLRRLLNCGIKMTERQIAAKVREYFHKQSPAIEWKSNRSTQCGNKFL